MWIIFEGSEFFWRKAWEFTGLILLPMPGVAALQPARFALGLRVVFRTTPGLPHS